MLFNPADDLVTGQSLYVYNRYLEMAKNLHPDRMRVIERLRAEVQELLDYLVQLKGVEENLLSTFGLPTGPLIGENGVPTSNYLTTLPEFSIANRPHLTTLLGLKKFAEKTETKSRSLQNFGVQEVNVGMSEVLGKLRNEDRRSRRLTHKILQARLSAMQRVQRLVGLLEELEKVSGAEGSNVQ